MKGILLTPWVLFALSCSRPQTATLQVLLPEVESEAELNLIREALWEEEESLPERITFYTAVSTSMTPEPSIEITYVTRHLRKQNVLHRLHERGYTVEGRSGEPAKRLAFLAESTLR